MLMKKDNFISSIQINKKQLFLKKLLRNKKIILIVWILFEKFSFSKNVKLSAWVTIFG